MATDYNEFAALATELIEEFGAAGSVYTTGTESSTDMFGNVITGEPATVISGTITPLLQYDSAEVDGSVVLVGDCYAFFDSTNEPLEGMLATVNGVEWRIVGVTKFDSADGIKVYRKLQLRR